MTTIISFLYSSLFFFTPFLFTSFNSELFELPKMYFVYLVTILIVFFHLINYFQGHVSLFQKNRLQLIFFLFLLSQSVSTIFSIDLHTSLFGYYSRLNGGLISLISYFLLFSILLNYLTDHLKTKIINISLLSGLLVSSFGILEHFGIDKNLWIQDVQARVFSTLGQPNWLAAYLCILLPFAIDKFLKSKIYSLKSFFFLFLVSNFYLCLLFTKSKSGIIAAIISLGIYFVIKFLQKTKIKILIIPLLIFSSFSLIVSNPIKDYLFPVKISPDQIRSDILITPSEDIRKIVWQGSLDLWQQFPLFGTGPETFAYTYYWTRPASHNLTSEWDFLYNKAHNEYLNYLATTGTIGFLTYLSFIITVLYLLINNIFNFQKYPSNNCKKILSPSRWEGPGVDLSNLSNLNIAILASFISILITNFAGFSVVTTSLFFFILPSLAFSPSPISTISKSKNYFLLRLAIASCIGGFLITKTISFYLADIAYNHSLAYSEKSQLDLSQKYIDSALTLRGNEAIYHSQASLIASKLGQIDLAITESDFAIRLSPANTNLWKERAQVYSTLALTNPQYFATAIDALDKVSRLAPTDAKTFYLLGRFYEAASKPDLAINNYQKAIALKSNYDHAYFSLGQLYFQNKNYPEAKKNLELTLIYAPTNLEAQNYLHLIATASAKKK